MQRISIGFDGMCSDVSVIGLGPGLGEIRDRWPRLAPLIDSLRAGRDEELTCEAEGIGQAEFFEILDGLKEQAGARVDVHIGANCALEVVTAANLLADRVDPVADAAIDYLGFWAPGTLERVPERIPREFLSRARAIEDSEAVSLIPHAGKRVILSFGGDPPVRSLSPTFRSYLTAEAPRYYAEVRPDLQILVGTACTWSAAEPGDFELLRGVIRTARQHGTRVLCDLGGLGSWSTDTLRDYFDVLGEPDILSMNESELGVYFREKTGAAPLGTGAHDLAAMVRDVVRPGQGFLVHTPSFQLAYGLDGPAEQALKFAGVAASLRGSTGVFPTARQVLAARLPVSETGLGQIRGLPSTFAAAPGFAVEVTNPVGLGDTWTCSFALSYLGGRP